YIYNRDLNDPFYINANLPAAQSAYVGVDNRPNWVGVACAATGQVGPCITRINNATGNQVTSTIVLKNTNQNRSWNVAGSVTRPFKDGFTFKGAYSYGVSRGIVEPGSTAAASWNANPIVTDPNNPSLAFSTNSPGHRFFLTGTYSKNFFRF